MNKNNILNDLSLLYELSLSIGQSLDLQKNCEAFLKVLVRRKGLDYASVWIDKDILGHRSAKRKGLELAYAIPEPKVKKRFISADHPLPTTLGGQTYLSASYGEENFQKLSTDPETQKGAFAVFRLSDIGILKLYTSSKSDQFTKMEMEQLKQVVQKFAISLKGCLHFDAFKLEFEERKKAEAAVLESNRRFQDLFQHMEDALWVTDATGKVLERNPAADRLLGYSPEEPIMLEQVIHPEERMQYAEYLQQLRHEGQYSGYVGRVVTKQGKTKYIEMNSTAIFNAEEQYMGSRDLVRNITQRIESDREIKKNEAITRQIIGSSLDAVVISDQHGRITHWNEQAERVFGWKQSEAIGSPMSALVVPPRYRKAHHEGMERHLKTGETRILNSRLEMPALHKLGHEFLVELTVTSIDLDGEVFYSSFMRDISEKKRAEQELIEARNKAEESVRLKERFLANMSHEIRTPMNAILGMGRLMKETPLNERQEQYLRALTTASDNLLVIINDILDLSKIEAGKLSIESINFNLKKLTENLLNISKPLAAEKGISLTINYDEQLPHHFMGDPVRINQILSNLVNNAIKFTAVGGVTLSCLLQEKKDGKCLIQCHVADTGVGIDKARLSNIFESFSQEDDSTTRNFGGSGLGLTISRQLAELMGGCINVRSIKGAGSTFTLELSLLEATQAAREEQHESNLHTQTLKGIQVLLAEDNEFNRMYAVELFEQLGWDFGLAKNGKEAIDALKTQEYDLVLMDVHMPVMDGIEATQIIRQMLDNHVPILALTASAIKGDREKFLAAGMDDYLSKPFKKEQLLQKAKSLLNSLHEVTAPTAHDGTKELLPAVKPEYDLHSLLELIGENKQLLNNMLEMFIKIVDETAGVVEEFEKSGKFEPVRKQAHKAKSSMESLGMFNALSIARHLESFDFTGSVQHEALQKAKVMVGLMQEVAHEFQSMIDAQQLKA